MRTAKQPTLSAGNLCVECHYQHISKHEPNTNTWVALSNTIANNKNNTNNNSSNNNNNNEKGSMNNKEYQYCRQH